MRNIEGIGKFDRKIIIQQEVFERNRYNEKVSAGWEKVADAWAKVLPNQGNEIYLADQLTSVMTTTFLIRYRRNLDVQMRVVFEDKVYKINSITEPEGTRRKYLFIKTELDAEAEV